MAEKKKTDETTTEETEVVEETTPEAPAAESETAPAAEPVAEEPVAEEEPAAEETPAEEPVAEAEEPAAEETPAQEPEAVAEPEPEPEAAAEEPAEEPAAEAEPEAAEPEAEAPAGDAAPAAVSGPKPKRKRVPRPLRRQRAKTPRGNSTGERKPIVRLEKPEHERGRRQERQGTVVSAVQDKTIVVQVATVKAHPRYKKVVRRSQRFHAHDERNEAKVGDVVRIVETRPVSKLKRWRLAEVVEEAK
jgi:small subunit ribosomal protein S17